jgi:hypothetical protein
VNPVDNSTVEVPKTTAVAEAVNARIRADNQRLALGQATPAQVQDEQLHTFSQAGIKQQQWSDTLNGAAHGAASTSLTQPVQQANAKAAYQLYSDLRAKNPAYLATLLDNKATAVLQHGLHPADLVRP